MTPTILLATNENDSLDAESMRQNRIRLTKRMFSEGWYVVPALSRKQIYAKIASDFNISAIVLDGTGQIGDDFSYTGLKSLRNSTDAPILLITDISDEKDELEILNCGIDGILCQPVSDSIIIAHIKNFLKRTGAISIRKFEYDGLYISQSEHLVEVDGVPVFMTPKEFNLLTYFAQNPNIALTRYQILNNAWGPNYGGSERTVDSHVKSLRVKLGKMGDCIETIRSVGYKFICNKPSETVKSL